MKYPYMVFDGVKLYKAGEEVPETKEKVSGTEPSEEKKVEKPVAKRGRPSKK